MRGFVLLTPLKRVFLRSAATFARRRLTGTRCLRGGRTSPGGAIAICKTGGLFKAVILSTEAEEMKEAEISGEASSRHFNIDSLS